MKIKFINRFLFLISVVCIFFANYALLTKNESGFENSFEMQTKVQNMIRNTNQMKTVSQEFLNSMFNKANLLDEISMLEKKSYSSKKKAMEMAEGLTENELTNMAQRKRAFMEGRNTNTSKFSDMSMLQDGDKLLEKFRSDFFKHLKTSNSQMKLRHRITGEERQKEVMEEKKIKEGYSRENKNNFKSFVYNEYEDIKNKIFELEKVDNGKWLKVTTAQAVFGLPNPGGKCDKNGEK